MKKLLILATILSLLTLSQTMAAQTNFKTYSNARFGYSIAYPANLLVPQGEAENGDGQAFKGDGALMLVFGSNYIAEESLRKDFELSVSEFGAKNVTYKLFRKNYYVFSGRKDGKILYQKTMKKPDGVYVTFTIEYDESKRAIYDKAVTGIAKSFK
jgi:hypothetical protein